MQDIDPISAPNSPTSALDCIFGELASTPSPWGPVIACLHTGQPPTTACAPMPRHPEPPIGQPFGASFLDVYLAVVGFNPATHDGAVMLGRDEMHSPYFVRGWSFRLFPPALAHDAPPNRGSAFNSCLAMSTVQGVDAMFLVSRGEVHRFEAGRATRLPADRAGRGQIG